MKETNQSSSTSFHIPGEPGYTILISEKGNMHLQSSMSCSYSALFYVMLEHSLHALDGMPCRIVGPKILEAMSRIQQAEEILEYASVEAEQRHHIITNTKGILMSLFMQCVKFNKKGVVHIIR